jgi:hypothetical protein
MDRLDIATLRAEEARQIMGNPMFEAAFNDTRAALMEAWAGLPSPDDAHAKDLHRMVKCLEKVKRCLEAHITTGKIAAKEIESRKKRLFSFGDRE